MITKGLLSVFHKGEDPQTSEQDNHILISIPWASEQESDPNSLVSQWRWGHLAAMNGCCQVLDNSLSQASEHYLHMQIAGTDS